MRWDDLHEHQPRLAAIAAERLVAPGVLLVVTIRADGAPRLSPVEPFVLDGDLWLSMMLGSRKAADLVRDPRVLVHSVTLGDCVAGRTPHVSASLFAPSRQGNELHVSHRMQPPGSPGFISPSGSDDG